MGIFCGLWISYLILRYIHDLLDEEVQNYVTIGFLRLDFHFHEEFIIIVNHNRDCLDSNNYSGVTVSILYSPLPFCLYLFLSFFFICVFFFPFGIFFNSLFLSYKKCIVGLLTSFIIILYWWNSFNIDSWTSQPGPVHLLPEYLFHMESKMVILKSQCIVHKL